jgi:hypothetical protein
MKTYYLDEDQLSKLRAISDKLHSGSDKERDMGHKLMLVLREVEGGQEFDPAKPLTDGAATQV